MGWGRGGWRARCSTHPFLPLPACTDPRLCALLRRWRRPARVAGQGRHRQSHGRAHAAVVARAAAYTALSRPPAARLPRATPLPPRSCRPRGAAGWLQGSTHTPHFASASQVRSVVNDSGFPPRAELVSILRGALGDDWQEELSATIPPTVPSKALAGLDAAAAAALQRAYASFYNDPLAFLVGGCGGGERGCRAE